MRPARNFLVLSPNRFSIPSLGISGRVSELDVIAKRLHLSYAVEGFLPRTVKTAELISGRLVFKVPIDPNLPQFISGRVYYFHEQSLGANASRIINKEVGSFRTGLFGLTKSGMRSVCNTVARTQRPPQVNFRKLIYRLLRGLR